MKCSMGLFLIQVVNSKWIGSWYHRKVGLEGTKGGNLLAQIPVQGERGWNDTILKHGKQVDHKQKCTFSHTELQCVPQCWSGKGQLWTSDHYLCLFTPYPCCQDWEKRYQLVSVSKLMCTFPNTALLLYFMSVCNGGCGHGNLMTGNIDIFLPFVLFFVRFTVESGDLGF